jgi:hypothetical protein
MNLLEQAKDGRCRLAFVNLRQFGSGEGRAVTHDGMTKILYG